MIQAITIILSGILMSWGGYSWHNARRFIMPILITSSLFWITHSFWSFFSLSGIAVLSLGYGENSKLDKTVGSRFVRGAWGLLACLALSLGMFVSHFLGFWCFLGYLLAGTLTENLLQNINQIIGDFLIGCSFGTLVLLIHP